MLNKTFHTIKNLARKYKTQSEIVSSSIWLWIRYVQSKFNLEGHFVALIVFKFFNWLNDISARDLSVRTHNIKEYLATSTQLYKK